MVRDEFPLDEKKNDSTECSVFLKKKSSGSRNSEKRGRGLNGPISHKIHVSVLVVPQLETWLTSHIR